MIDEKLEKPRIIKLARVAILFRYGLIAFLVIFGLPFASIFGAWEYLFRISVLSATIFLYNSLGYLYIEKKKERMSFKDLRNGVFSQVLADVLILTCLIHFSGGIFSPHITLYLFPVITAGMVLYPFPFISHLVTGTISLLYIGLLILEYLAILPLPGDLPWTGSVHLDINGVAIFGILVPLSFWLITILGLRVGQTMRGETLALEEEMKGEITHLRIDLEKKLEETNAELYRKNKELESALTDRKRTEEELKIHTEELEKMNKFMVGRELDMIELKQEVNRLLQELGRPEKYRTEQYAP